MLRYKANENTTRAPLGNILLLLTLLLITHNLFAAKLSGQVVNITRNNHILLQTADGKRHQVKLAGIRFAPFSGRKRDVIKRHLHTLLAGRFVTVETITRPTPGVILGRVRHGGSDIGLRMIRSGLAFSAEPSAIANTPLESEYKKAEAAARRYKMGYWQTR